MAEDPCTLNHSIRHIAGCSLVADVVELLTSGTPKVRMVDLPDTENSDDADSDTKGSEPEDSEPKSPEPEDPEPEDLYERREVAYTAFTKVIQGEIIRRNSAMDAAMNHTDNGDGKAAAHVAF